MCIKDKQTGGQDGDRRRKRASKNERLICPSKFAKAACKKC